MGYTGKAVCILIAFFVLWFLLFFIAKEHRVYYEPTMSIREFALVNGIKPGRLKHELGYPTARGRTPVGELGLDPEKAANVIAHVKAGVDGRMPIALIVQAAVIGIALVLLRRRKMGSVVKCILLVVAVIGFGFVLGKTYNPMVALVKAGKVLAGIEAHTVARLAVFALFCLLAAIGTKAVCGWACPYGALQELLFKLPVLSSWKKKHKVPFWLSNSIRAALFGLFIAALIVNLFGLKQQGRGLYHAVNPFNLFEFSFGTVSVVVYIVLTLALSLVFYRPHCYFVCPFGIVSWVLERVSLFRVRIDREKCTGCGACVTACPGLAMKGLYENKPMPPDCFSCGECLANCKFDALSYTAGVQGESGVGPQTLKAHEHL